MTRTAALTFAFATTLWTAFATAQEQKEVCEVLNEPMNSASVAFGTLSVSINKLDVEPILPKLDTELRTSFEIMEQRRKALIPYLTAYLESLEDAALLVRRCAR